MIYTESHWYGNTWYVICENDLYFGIFPKQFANHNDTHHDLNNISFFCGKSMRSNLYKIGLQMWLKESPISDEIQRNGVNLFE